MARKNTKPAGSASGPSPVDRFMEGLDHPYRREIETLRRLILAADPRVREGVKWNAPSFYISEHFATFKLRPASTVQVVLHTGAKVKSGTLALALAIDDPLGMLTWAATDRCVATFTDPRDVEAKREAFVSIVKQWIAQTSHTGAPDPAA